MKKVILTLITILTVTATFAGNEEASVMNETKTFMVNFNARKIGEALDLSTDQLECINDIAKTFDAEMMNAAVAPNEEKKELVAQAIHNNLTNMSYILTPDQYKQYEVILNTTLKNRGLKK